MSKEGAERWFLLSLQNLDMEKIKKGAAQPFVSNGDIADQELVHPGDELIEVAEKVFESLFAQISSHSKETQALAQTRDLLLPKLMSGAIRLAGDEV